MAEPFLNGFGAGVWLIIVGVLYNQTELMEWRETERRVEDGKTAVSARGVGVVFKVHPSLWQGGRRSRVHAGIWGPDDEEGEGFVFVCRGAKSAGSRFSIDVCAGGAKWIDSHQRMSAKNSSCWACVLGVCQALIVLWPGSPRQREEEVVVDAEWD